MASRTFKVPNIMCGHCVHTIQEEVRALPGVTSVTADQQSKVVSVEWKEAEQKWENIRALLTEINYPPEE